MKKKQKKAYTIAALVLFLLFGIQLPNLGLFDERSMAEFEKQIEALEKIEGKDHQIETKDPSVVQHLITSSIEIPAYSGNSYIAINDNIPFFDAEDDATTAFEHYSDLDDLGRVGMAYANISKERMPTKKRESIGMIKPSGWHTVRYDDLVDGKYLYNRCHLIGFQLAGENANRKNLMTGTRYMNTEGMLPFENMVADYVHQTNHHVLYRVTPIYRGDNLVADGVLMEARSVEDHGQGIQFNVFVYNIQPGILIDYKTGESKRGETAVVPGEIPSMLYE